MNKTFCLTIALTALLVALPAVAGDLGPRATDSDVVASLPSVADPADSEGGGSESQDLPYQRRIPALAGVLSLVLPGSGQIYNEQYLVGSLWMAGEIALYLGAFAYAGAFTTGEDFNFNWRLESSILVALAAGFHLYSIFDAVIEADRVNENLDKFSVSYNPSSDSVSVGYAFAW